MSAFAYLRHPFALLAAVALLVGALWYALGLPAQMPPSPLAAGEKLACLFYAPEDLAPERIEADLAALARHASCVRTERTGMGFDRVPEIAARFGLAVLQGVAVGRDAGENRAEIERAAAIAETRRGAVRAFVVGSDVLGRRELRTAALAALVRELRARTKLPVTSAETPDAWLDADLLADAVDFITLRLPLYDAPSPVAAGDAAAHLAATHAALAARFPGKEVALVESGWPSAGRMREAALPSPAAQARVLHDLLAASKRGKFQLALFEGIDQPARAAARGTASAHWGLLDADSREPKFRWGGAVADHPLWRMQASMGVMFALVIFAAGFLAARSLGPDAPAAVKWEPVALAALGAGAFLGWAVADLPVQSHSAAGWALHAILLLLALAVPPLAAAAMVRGVPFEGFAALLDPARRRAAHPLARAVAAAFALTVFFAIQAGLVLALDPGARGFPFAALTGPAAALLLLSLTNPAGPRHEGTAENAAALLLAGSALLIVLNEWFWNWQAWWLAAALLALALACRRAARAQRP